MLSGIIAMTLTDMVRKPSTCAHDYSHLVDWCTHALLLAELWARAELALGNLAERIPVYNGWTCVDLPSLLPMPGAAPS